MIHFGNAALEAPEHQGWFVGHFMSEEDARYSRDVEVKCQSQKAGDRRPWVKGRNVTTLGILLKGKVVQYFPDCEVLLEKEFDYVIFDHDVPHASEVLEDALVLTIRWPSQP